jgi:flagellar hook assembly protein FlgD
MRSNVPNPFQSRTTITFDLARSAPVSLVVYDVSGRRVRTLVDGAAELGAGAHTADWNGLDDGGRRVPAGLYFARLEARGEAATMPAATRRMVVTR